MPALTNTDVAELMKRLNAEYQPKGVCAATPRKMRLLLDELQKYTAEVQWARNKYQALAVASVVGGAAGIPAGELLGGGDVDVAQWRSDMANWQHRLAEYQRVLDVIPDDQLDTEQGCVQIYPLVTAPLLDGIWYEVLPGIVLNKEERTRIMTGTAHPSTDVPGNHAPGHSNPKPPDAISPFTLGNQIVVYQDFQRENAERFFKDLIDNAKKLSDPSGWPWWVKAALVAGAGLTVGMVGLYVYQFLPQPRAGNPRRRRRNPLTADQKHVLNAVASAGGWETTETLYDLVGESDEDDPYEAARAAVGGLERKGLLRDRPSSAAMGAVELTAKGRTLTKGY